MAASRFAVLSIEDDEDESDQQSPGVPNGQPHTGKSAAAKKRNRKKKKTQSDQAEKAELRELAFGLGASKPKHHNQGQSVGGGQGKKKGAGDSEEAQWNEWRKADETFTHEQYESDMQEAILQSKLDLEKKLELQNNEGSAVNGNEKEGKKKKQKKKGMSLEEFNQLDENAAEQQPHSSESKEFAPDTEFFSRVDADTSKTLMKEKIQEEYTKQYIVQNARTAHYEKEISKKDKEIIMLRATITKLKEEAQDAKQRNQQLCNILAQGEMKDKAAVLQSYEELTQVKNELMEEIKSLTAELEKEKSKSHKLELDLKRYQTKSSKQK